MPKFNIGDRVLSTFYFFDLVNAPGVVLGYNEIGTLYDVAMLEDGGTLKAGQRYQCLESRLSPYPTVKRTVAEIEKLLGYGVEIVSGK